MSTRLTAQISKAIFQDFSKNNCSNLMQNQSVSMHPLQNCIPTPTEIESGDQLHAKGESNLASQYLVLCYCYGSIYKQYNTPLCGLHTTEHICLAGDLPHSQSG